MPAGKLSSITGKERETPPRKSDYRKGVAKEQSQVGERRQKATELFQLLITL
jgi:hypothetical protein